MSLQAHVAFFDRDGDGVIAPWDTYRGFRDIGFGLLLALNGAFLIHLTLSYLTYGTLLPDPLFRIRVKHIHKGTHGSSSGAYTSRGRFDRARFDNTFNLYTTAPHTHITLAETMQMVHGNVNAYDVFGVLANLSEWLTAYLVIWPADGRMAKEDILGIYDGSYFYKVSGRKPPSSCIQKKYVKDCGKA
ncbi:Caleosin [Schizophyllum amplum]|uniref:Caleosin n=1 Tax=Schizophyllum amplum TaxID=97359 RepID=A0A550BXY4_9AGAR|nr:Caleosin [Auriculariopsis ampla]